MADATAPAAWLRRHDALPRVGWDGGILLDSERFPHTSLPVPRTAPSVANTLFKGQMLIVPAGGGFSINPWLALEQDNLATDRDAGRDPQRDPLQFPADRQAWWWD